MHSTMGEIGKSFPNAPFTTFNEALDFLNRAQWHLKVAEDSGHWNLWAGDGELHLYRADSNQELEAFVMGMALTFAMIGPDELPGFEPWNRV